MPHSVIKHTFSVKQEGLLYGPQFDRDCDAPQKFRINPLSPNSDQHQFSPNNIHRLSRDKVVRINKMITTDKMPWSFFKFSQVILKGSVWRTVWRICMWILGLKPRRRPVLAWLRFFWPLTKGGGGGWDFRFCQIFRSAFRFLHWKTSVFRLCCPLQFPVFRFFSIRFFGKNKVGLIPLCVSMQSYVRLLSILIFLLYCCHSHIDFT